MDDVGLIADRTVQEEYRQFIRDRLFGSGAVGRARAPGSRSVPGSNSVRAGPRRRRRRSARSRVAGKPTLASSSISLRFVDQVAEELAALDIPEPELDSLRRRILELDAARSGA